MHNTQDTNAACEKAYSVSRELTIGETLQTRIYDAERALKALRDIYDNLPKSYLSRPVSFAAPIFGR